ncbi:PAS domain-containing protein [Halorubrum sp. DTA98]|uniref:PAS domain-containing protein n=1 Tax=Halorubrum sp. DTA98 TaxID=3402163 RepID=UPI003AB08EB1
MDSDPPVVLVVDDSEREHALVDVLTSTGDEVITVESVSEIPETDTAESTVVVARDDATDVVESVEAALDRVDLPSVVVYADRLSESTVRGLLASDRVEYVPRNAPGDEALLASRIRRIANERRDGRIGRTITGRVPPVLDDVSEAVFAINPDRSLVYCNRAAEDLFGASRESVLGRGLSDVPAISGTDLERELIRSMDRGERTAIETTVDGTRYDVRAYPSAAGQFVFARDVTERHERDQLFRAAFEGAMDAMVIADDDGRYVDVNPAAVDLFGTETVEGLIGRSIAEFAPEEYDVAASWDRFHASDHERGLFPLISDGGDRRVVEFAATPNVLDGRHLSVLRDVTGRAGYPSFRSIIDDARRPPVDDGG